MLLLPDINVLIPLLAVSRTGQEMFGAAEVDLARAAQDITLEITGNSRPKGDQFREIFPIWIRTAEWSDSVFQFDYIAWT